MTARPQVELPELPEPINDGSRGFGQLWNPLYSEDQMHAYAQQAIAESEARAEDARDAAKKVLLKIAAQFDEMAQACQHEDEYTRRDVWLNAAHQARKRTEHPCWIDAAIAQEAEREAGSA